MSARRSERLLNLFIALLVSRGYVPKQRLRQVIPDYADAPSDEAFEKMFERDKDTLRALGIPIEVGSHEALFDDEPGYRIVRSAFELPEIAFEPDEAAVLGLAARVWQQASLASATSDALLKLKAGGVDVDRTALDVVAPQVAADEPAFPVVWEGVVTRRPVTFDYRASDAPRPTRRTVEPWGIVSYRSRWYAVGRDLDRDEHRLFRLSRVVGTVTFAGEEGSFTVPPGTDVRALAGLLAPETPDRTAELRVRADRALALRRRSGDLDGAPDGAQDGWDRIALPFGRTENLADELAAHGADVVVEAPDDLRAAVRRRLAAVAGVTP